MEQGREGRRREGGREEDRGESIQWYHVHINKKRENVEDISIPFTSLKTK